MNISNVVSRPVLRTAACGLLLTLALSGCSEVKRSLGFEKMPPDEFQVVSRAPLSMPPDFALRPPAPGSTRPQENTTREQARQALLGTRQVTPISTAGRSQGDMALLKRAGAEGIQPDIRSIVNKETQALAEADKSLADRIVFWRKTDPSGEAVDPAKEAQRLRENQALGKSLSDGDTPLIQRRQRGWLEGVFD
ncbi:MAG: DUF3035 domain-containing protein [Actinomycetota bacterium]